MNRLPGFSFLLALFVSACMFSVAGCRAHAASAAVGSAAAQDQGPDPAAQNLAPPDNGSAPAGPSYATQGPPPPGQAGAQYPPNQPFPPNDDEQYNEEPTETAPEPPPPLPVYEQPPCPGPGYIWTPGYWAWSPSGYYWVPGAWVEPPYLNALWTPGYWGFYGGRYSFFPGHWGLHIGFYGGINYGFGYFGVGYEGGYWHGGHFFYNRVYNNVNLHGIHDVYSYRASNRAYNNSHVSFHGGAHGMQARPGPQERSAWREPVAPRMNTQVQHAQSFRSNRGQMYAVNHGRPANATVRQPIRAEHNVHPEVPRSGGNRGGERH